MDAHAGFGRQQKHIQIEPACHRPEMALQQTLSVTPSSLKNSYSSSSHSERDSQASDFQSEQGINFQKICEKYSLREEDILSLIQTMQAKKLPAQSSSTSSLTSQQNSVISCTSNSSSQPSSQQLPPNNYAVDTVIVNQQQNEQQQAAMSQTLNNTNTQQHQSVRESDSDSQKGSTLNKNAYESLKMSCTSLTSEGKEKDLNSFVTFQQGEFIAFSRNNKVPSFRKTALSSNNSTLQQGVASSVTNSLKIKTKSLSTQQTDEENFTGKQPAVEEISFNNHSGCFDSLPQQIQNFIAGEKHFHNYFDSSQVSSQSNMINTSALIQLPKSKQEQLTVNLQSVPFQQQQQLVGNLDSWKSGSTQKTAIYSPPQPNTLQVQTTTTTVAAPQTSNMKTHNVQKNLQILHQPPELELQSSTISKNSSSSEAHQSLQISQLGQKLDAINKENDLLKSENRELRGKLEGMQESKKGLEQVIENLKQSQEFIASSLKQKEQDYQNIFEKYNVLVIEMQSLMKIQTDRFTHSLSGTMQFKQQQQQVHRLSQDTTDTYEQQVQNSQQSSQEHSQYYNNNNNNNNSNNMSNAGVGGTNSSLQYNPDIYPIDNSSKMPFFEPPQVTQQRKPQFTAQKKNTRPAMHNNFHDENQQVGAQNRKKSLSPAPRENNYAVQIQQQRQQQVPQRNAQKSPLRAINENMPTTDRGKSHSQERKTYSDQFKKQKNYYENDKLLIEEMRNYCLRKR